jgi:hypothetical protein
MGPRRMDGFARPTMGGPQPGSRPAEMPAQRPAPQPLVAAPQPAVRLAPRPMARPVAPQGYDRAAYGPQAAPGQPGVTQTPQAPAKPRKGGWRVVLQFIVGLLVIIGVAAAIVALYIRYYQ